MNGTVEVGDVQGLVARGYGRLKVATFRLFTVADAVTARGWLKAVAPLVTSSDGNPDDFALNLAFTHDGLRSLGLPAGLLAQFPVEYAEGMATPHRRRVLGDLGQNAPEEWRWGGPGNPPVHVLVLLYAADETALARAEERCLGPERELGMEEVAELATIPLTDKEHFGFHDGVSQPVIDGLHQPGPWANSIRPGEFLLGYENEYGQYARSLLADPASDAEGVLGQGPSSRGDADFGLNGSYLVFRQLSQDVRGFWRYLEEVTRNPDGTTDDEAMVKLGAKWVGRWPSGAPLVTCPEVDDPSQADFNDFGYHESDPAGLRCPIGSHVRRSHPRDSLDPDPGSRKSIAIGKRHRIVRRGRQYGAFLSHEERLEPSPPDGEEERGLHFMCLNANLARQFEFIQHTWVNNPKFGGLYDDSDPLLGSAVVTPGSTFTVPARPLRRRVTGIPRFTQVRGGAYFFLPGLRATRYLAGLS